VKKKTGYERQAAANTVYSKHNSNKPLQVQSWMEETKEARSSSKL